MEDLFQPEERTEAGGFDEALAGERHREIALLEEYMKESRLIGEIGLFAPGNRRSASAVCRTDCVICSFAGAEVVSLVDKEPGFGLHLAQLIARRMHEDQGRLIGVPPTAAAEP